MEEIDSNIIIVGDVNIPLTSMDRSSKQKVSKETLALNDTLDKMDTHTHTHTHTHIYTHIYIYDILFKSRIIQILIKYTMNILQDRSHTRPQNKSQ